VPSPEAQAPTAAAAETPAPTRAEAPGQTAPPAALPAASALPVIPDVPGPLKLELATLKRLYDANAAFVLDAREAAEYSEGHISGAISLPYNDALADPDRVSHLDPGGRPIVVYCSGGDCELSMDLAKVLVQAGRRRVLIYEGGFPEWQGAGYPVARGPNP
jgi:rhodanese-related sulfurtransferase